MINPGTSHRDIMVLANNPDSDDESNHRFLYARVLGIYHINVIYTGDGSVDYTARRVEFLWVRWFDYDGNNSFGWTDFKLDPVRFLPTADEGAFGFVDPNDVLRGCHVVPAFARGKSRTDGIGLSRLAGDSQDWSEYRVNRCVLRYLNTNPYIDFRAAFRFVDRDMVMRFYWGFAAGHIYTHAASNNLQTQPLASTTHDEDSIRDLESDMMTSGNASGILEHENDTPDLDDPQFSLENHEDELLDEEDEDSEKEQDDEGFLTAMY